MINITEIPLYRIVVHRFKYHLKRILYYIVDRVRYNRDYKYLKTIKGSAEGKSVFVFANGPSLSSLDPNKVSNLGLDVFAVNGYLWSDFSKVVSPTHYVLSDLISFSPKMDHVYTEEQKELARKFKKLQVEISEKNIQLFVPMKFLNKTLTKNKIGFCDIENTMSNNVENIGSPRGYLSMTAYKALAISLYLGYDNIYICGFDNDYFKMLEADENNDLYFYDKHFFDSGNKRYLKDLRSVENVGDFLFKDHFLFLHLEKFSSDRIVNLDKNNLNVCFSKQHDLDIYKDLSDKQ